MDGPCPEWHMLDMAGRNTARVYYRVLRRHRSPVGARIGVVAMLQGAYWLTCRGL